RDRAGADHDRGHIAVQHRRAIDLGPRVQRIQPVVELIETHCPSRRAGAPRPLFRHAAAAAWATRAAFQFQGNNSCSAFAFVRPETMRSSTSARHDPALVTLSILIAVLASYTALDLGGRVRTGSGWSGCAWIAAASVAMGG